MKYYVQTIIFLLIIRTLHLKIFKSIKIKKILREIERLVLIGIVICMLSNYDNKLVGFLLMIVSLRFLLKLIRNISFKNGWDLGVSLISLYYFITYIGTNKGVNNIVDKIINLKSESHLLHVALIHLFFLFLVFTITTFIIMLVIAGYIFIIYPATGEINAYKNVIYKYIYSFNDFIKKHLNIDVLKFLNEYINPFNGMKVKGLSKNIKLIRKIFLILYIFTGIVVIFYWKEAIRIMEIISKEELNTLLDLPINQVDLDNYKMVFVMPLLGILLNKTSSSTEKI